MVGDGRTGSYLGAIGQSCPGLVLAVGTALAQQDPSAALDKPDDLSGCYEYSLSTKHLNCLATKRWLAAKDLRFPLRLVQVFTSSRRAGGQPGPPPQGCSDGGPGADRGQE
jgi:hypothetical protein